MRLRTLAYILLFMTTSAGAAFPQPQGEQSARHVPNVKLVEPHLHLVKTAAGSGPRVAVTLDACMGALDDRILSVLVAERIPATIFVTARWLRRNPETVAVFRANPDLFEIENHGENHVPAIDVPMPVYGIAAAGSPEAVSTEVAKGAEAIIRAGFPAPRWFRGATAKYDRTAIEAIRAMGYRIAGYSLNGDDGSLLGPAVAEKRIAAARDGDVIISHINQPGHAAGQGVAGGLRRLKARGAIFVRLSDVEVIGDNDTTTPRPGLF